MVTKEAIKAEVDKVSDEHLAELYALVETFTRSKEHGKEETLMAKLKRIKIDAPEDFAANFDLYMSGEKRAEPGLR